MKDHRRRTGDGGGRQDGRMGDEGEESGQTDSKVYLM